MTNREQFTTEIYVNNEQAQDATEKLTKKLDIQTREWERLRNELGDFDKETLKAKKAMESTQASLDKARQGCEVYRDALDNLSEQSIGNLVKMQKQLKKELEKTKPDTEEWNRLSKEYQQVTERVDGLKKAQKGIETEGQKSTSAFKSLFKKVNEFYGGLLVYAKAAKAALQAVITVTKQVVNASQTMGDKWNNAMATMKTTTDAFFMALSTGDWSAFNDGIGEAIRRARELAELEDLLGSFKIAEGYIQSKDIVDIQNARNTATDTKADVEQRKQALEDMKEAIDRYNEFVTAKGEATYQDLIKSFEAWKGITFESEGEFEQFFDRLFRYSTTNRDEELARAQQTYEHTWKTLSARHKDAYGQIVQDYTATEAKQIALEKVTMQYGEETAKLLQAVEINDEKHTKLVQTYAQYANSIQVVNQQTRTYQRTRDQVNKQLYASEVSQLQKANNVTLNLWKAQYAKGIIDKATFETKKTELEQQALQQRIGLAQKYGQDATDLYTKQWDDIIKKMEDDVKKADDALNKAYDKASKKIDKAEAAQLNTLKGLYASGIMDKETYEAQKAVVEEDYLKQRMATAEQYGKDTDQFMNQLLDRQIARMQKAKELLKEEMGEMEKYYSNLAKQDEDIFLKKNPYKGKSSKELEEEAFTPKNDFQAAIWKKAAEIRAAITEDSARTEYETEVKWAQKLAEQKKITAEEAEKYILQAKLKYAQAAAQQVSQITEQASNFVTALREMESAQLEAQYQADLTAAGDNAEKREEIESEYEQKKLDLQKKYADVDMAINIAKAVAAGALAAVEAFAAAGGNPVLGGAFAAIIAANTAAEVATIIAQRNAIKNTSVSSGSKSAPKTGKRTLTGYAEGGYTEDHTTLTTVGERGTEWVAPHWMVARNPVTFANLERYRKAGSHGRSGSMELGFAEGGFTGKGGGPSTGSGTAVPIADIDWQAMREFNAMMRYCAENGLFVKYGDIKKAAATDARFKSQTTRG